MRNFFFMTPLSGFLLIFTLSPLRTYADSFEGEARQLATDLKTALVTQLNQKITENGPIGAIPFCHAEVKTIAQGAAQDRATKFEFGRTSHRIRNTANTAQTWMKPYIREFEGKTLVQAPKKTLIHSFKNGKKAYLEPLFIQPQCLTCHGESVAPEIHARIRELYPNDRAMGFKQGEFRGFLWVKEK